MGTAQSVTLSPSDLKWPPQFRAASFGYSQRYAPFNVRLCLGRKEDLRLGSSALRTVRASDGNKA
jgi:hypothetical protein